MTPPPSTAADLAPFVEPLALTFDLYDDDEARKLSLPRDLSDDDRARVLADARDWASRGARTATAAAEQSTEPTSDRETAARLACEAELWHTPGGDAFATIEVRSHTEHVPIRSRRFRAWLTLRFEAARGKAPSTDALSVAQTMAEARAALEGDEHDVCVRLAQADGRLYLDLCDEQRRVIEIDASGWRLVEEAPVKFQRPADALALPVPEPGGSLDALRPFVNAGSDDDFALILAWLIGAMAPDGPYPLLALYGEQGSAKSSTSRRLRGVFDPSHTATRESPKNTRDLAVAARGSRVLAFDNLSWLNAEMSNALCRLATGAGFGTRRLYTDDEEATFYAARPVILNGIEEIATRGDLLSRSIVLQLPTIEHPRDERSLDDAWAAAWPGILGSLLDAVTASLGHWDETRLEQPPRMADFARWVEASGAVPGWLDAYAANRSDASSAEIDASAFAAALLDLAQTAGRWEGTAADLLGALTAATELDARGRYWPTTAKATSDRLRRHAPALREHDIEVNLRRSHGVRRIEIVARAADAAAGLPV